MPITRKEFLHQAGMFSLGFTGFQLLTQRLAGGRINPGLAEDFFSVAARPQWNL